MFVFFFFQAEDGIRDFCLSRGLGDVYKRQQYKIEYVCESKEYTVEGLKETKKIDPFEGVTVEFSGTSPNVSAKVVNNSKDEVYENIYYDLSKSYDIKIGDTITVTVSNDPEYFVEAYGCVFTSTCLLYTSDAADEKRSVDIGGRRILKKKKKRTRCEDGM